MESTEEELLENVTDESGNSYMIQRMSVDNSHLLNSEILQTPNGLVVDLGGDFIPVNYTSEDLLTHDITEEDRNLAAALVAVQFSQQQKQQQSQQDGSVIINTTLPSLMTGFDGTKVRIGEQQVLLQDKQTGIIQIVDADELYKEHFAKYDKNNQTLQIIKTEDEAVTATLSSIPERKSTKKSLPHKKRLVKKLRRAEKPAIELQKCSFCEQLHTLDKIDEHQALCQNSITATITANAFACQICNASFSGQLLFFEHLKKHYEPIQEGAEIEQDVQHAKNVEEMEQEEDIESTELILKEENSELLHGETVIKIESNDDTKNLLPTFFQLTCLDCNKAFRRQKSYEAHMRDFHNQNVITEFNESEDIMNGIETDTTEKIVEDKEWYRDDELHATEEDLKELEAKENICTTCQQQFPSRALLLKHTVICQAAAAKLVKVREEGVLKRTKGRSKGKSDLECNICDRKFAHRNSLIYHMRSHTEDRPYQCEQCGKSFFAANALKVHLRLHSGEKPYACEFCGRNFRQWGDLKYHCISLHSDEKEYQCEYCGKEFARKYSLIVHRRIHTGEKNYRCEFCGKTFRASSYLQNHRRIHTGEKPHPCEVCGKRFRVRSDMKRHLRTHSKRRSGRVEEVKLEDDHDLQQESEDTSESITLLKEENDTAVQALQYEQESGLESIRDTNTLYVHMPILIS